MANVATQNPTGIRPAVHADIADLVELFAAHHREMGCSWSVNRDRLGATIASAIASPDTWICLAGDGCFLLAACFESPLGAGRLAQELCFCAPPRRLADVINLYEEWARSKHCRAVSLSCEQRFGTFDRLFRRYGYTTAEMTAKKEL